MTETPHTQLLPCPFCGGEAMLAKKYAWCKRCGAEGEVAEPISKAIAAWNTRATPLPTTANNPETDVRGDLVEALRDIRKAALFAAAMAGEDDGKPYAMIADRADAALTKAEVTHG